MDKEKNSSIKKFLHAVKSAVMAMDVESLKQEQLSFLYDGFYALVSESIKPKLISPSKNANGEFVLNLVVGEEFTIKALDSEFLDTSWSFDSDDPEIVDVVNGDPTQEGKTVLCPILAKAEGSTDFYGYYGNFEKGQYFVIHVNVFSSSNNIPNIPDIPDDIGIGGGGKDTVPPNV